MCFSLFSCSFSNIKFVKIVLYASYSHIIQPCQELIIRKQVEYIFPDVVFIFGAYFVTIIFLLLHIGSFFTVTFVISGQNFSLPTLTAKQPRVETSGD